MTVKLYRVIDPGTICPAVLTPFTQSFMLDGGFESGTYTITVNGTTTEIEL